MPYDLPARLAIARNPDLAFDVLEADLVAEKASSLGHHGRLVEQAMAALGSVDRRGDPAERLKAVKNGARVAWAFFVQGELCGLRDQKQVIKAYGIPGEVLVRLGSVEKI